MADGDVPSHKGYFVSIEGVDGAGKSSHCALLVARLRNAGHDVLEVREPGGTALGEKVRPLVKGETDPSARAELLLFEAARAEIVERVIAPALESGSVVIADRFMDSSVAYQGYGRGLPLEQVKALNDFATGGLKPDFTVLLTVSAESGRERSLARDSDGSGEGRRFEEEPLEFHSRVREGFAELAAEEPDRWLVINADRPQEEVAEEIWSEVSSRLKQ